MDAVDADVEEFFASQKRARAAAFRRGMKVAFVMGLSSVLAIVTGILVAQWDHQSKVDRLERYRRGEAVFVARSGDSVTNTDPSPRLPVIAGLGVGLVVFALGAALVLRDKTYLRGLQSFMR